MSAVLSNKVITEDVRRDIVCVLFACDICGKPYTVVLMLLHTQANFCFVGCLYCGIYAVSVFVIQTERSCFLCDGNDLCTQ